jgi:hypothetical protein
VKTLLTALAVTVALSAPVTAKVNIEEVIHNKKLVLMSLGTAVYYSENCMGLTSAGKKYLNKAIELHKLYTYAFYTEKDFADGYEIAAKYKSCNKLRSDLTDVGLGAMVR